MMWPPDPVIRTAYARPDSDSLRYFDDKEHSDIVVHCGEEQFYVQKRVLCGWSEHFKRLLKDSAQIADGRLVLDEDNPDVLRTTLRYMYGAPYIRDLLIFTDEDALKLNQLYCLAKKYSVWSLVFDIWITFSEYIELGYAGSNFYKAIELAYQMNSDTDWLLAYIRRACRYNIKRLSEDMEFFRSLQRTPVLCVELLEYAVGKLDDQKHPFPDGLRLRCPSCRQFFTLHHSHVKSPKWMCAWCRYEAPSGARWDRLS